MHDAAFADAPLLVVLRAAYNPEQMPAFEELHRRTFSALANHPACIWVSRYQDVDSRALTAFVAIPRSADLAVLFQTGKDSSPNAFFIGIQGLIGQEGLGRVLLNCYEQISGSVLGNPLLSSERPLSIVTTDVSTVVESEWNEWYDASHVPHLLRVPGYVLAGRFRTLECPAVGDFNTGPRYLAIYELESEAVIPSLRPGPLISTEAKLELQYARARWAGQQSRFSWTFARLLSRHHKDGQPGNT